MFSFIGFFLIFIFIFVIAVLMKIVMTFVNLKRKVTGAFRGGQQTQNADEPQPQRRKRYDDGVGEYVKFEEIADDPVAEPIAPDNVEYREESQVSDVEFEEIPD